MSAWYLVDIDPVGFCNEKVRMAAIVSANDGIVTLSLHEDVDPSQFVVTADLYTDMIEERLEDCTSNPLIFFNFLLDSDVT